MGQTKFRRAFGFVLGELTEIIVEAIYRTAIEPCPKSRFTDGLTTGGDDFYIIVSGSADHMSVGFDVTHLKSKLQTSNFMEISSSDFRLTFDHTIPGQAPQAALVAAAGMGAVVG